LRALLIAGNTTRPLQSSTSFRKPSPQFPAVSHGGSRFVTSMSAMEGGDEFPCAVQQGIWPHGPTHWLDARVVPNAGRLMESGSVFVTETSSDRTYGGRSF
jgi:hypothetical protein